MAKEVKTGEFGVLEVINDDGSNKKVHALKPGSFAIGSSINAKIRLNNKKVQDLHCIVNVLENGVATLTPQSIFHPTKLNNNVLRKDKNALLNPGDIFIIGDIKILYKNDALSEQELQQKGKSIVKPKIFNTPRRGSAIIKHVTEQELQQKSKSVVKPKLFSTPRRASSAIIKHATEQELQQKSKSVVKPKLLSTPGRGSAVIKHVFMTNSAKKKFNSPIARLTSLQKRRSSASSLNESLLDDWTAEPVRESLMPSVTNSSCYPVERDAAVVDSPSHGSSIQRKLSKSAPSTPSFRGTKRVLSLLSSDNLTEDTSFDMVALKTTKKSAVQSPAQLITEEVVDLSSSETLKTILHVSTHNKNLVLGQPKKLTRTSVSDLSSVFDTKAEKRKSLCNKSFAAVSNKQTETPKTTTVFRTPTSCVRKFNKLNKSNEQVSSSPASVTPRSRSLSITSKPPENNTLEEPCAEDIEEEIALSPDLQNRLSRQSGNDINKNYDDTEQTMQDVACRSRNSTPGSRQSGKDTSNQSVMSNQEVGSSPTFLSINTENLTSRRSASVENNTSKNLKCRASMGKIKQAASSPVASPFQPSRSLFTASRQSENRKLDNSFKGNLEVYSPASNIAGRRSSLLIPRQFEGDMLPPLSSNISGRRSRRSLLVASPSESSTLTELKHGVSIGNVEQKVSSPINMSSTIETRRSKSLSSRQSENNKLDNSVKDNPQVYSPALNIAGHRPSLSLSKQFEGDMLPPNISGRRSKRSLLVASPSESSTLTELKHGVSIGNVEQKVSSPINMSSTIEARRSKSLSSRQSENNKLDNSVKDISPALNIAGRRSSLSRRFDSDMLPLSPNISGRRSKRSLLVTSLLSGSTELKRGVSIGNIERKVSTPLSLSSTIETRLSKSLSSKHSGNSLKNFKTFSSSTSTESNEDQNIETSLDSNFDDEENQVWKAYSNEPHDSLSTLDTSLGSSYMQTTGCSSFSYTTPSSVQLAEPMLDVSGIEKLLKTPKQMVQAKKSGSSIKSGRSFVEAMKDDTNGLINLSSTFTDDTSDDIDNGGVFENTEDDSDVIEQTSAVKTPKHDVSTKNMVQKTPNNDVSDVIGVKRILATPKLMKSFKNDLCDGRGIEKLTNTPKQTVQAKKSRSSVKSGRRSFVEAKEDNTSTFINLSSTFNDNTSDDTDNDSAFVNTEDDSIVLEQTLTVKTPKHDVSHRQTVQKSLTNVLSDVTGVKRVLATRKPMKSPKNDLRDIRGVKKIMKTPKTVKTPKNDLRSPPEFKQLFEIPKSPKNDLNDVRGVKRLLATPATQNLPENDLRDVRGVKKIMKTPKVANSPKNDLSNVPEFKQLFKVLKSPKNDLRDVKGVKGMLKTPKVRRSPLNDLRNPPEFKKLFDLPTSSRNNLDDLEGVEQLMATPVVIKPPKNDLTDVRGVKRLMKTPRLPKSPKNDLREPYGVKKLLATPKPTKSPKNDLDDVMGVDILMKTPTVPKSPKQLSEGVGVLDNILNAIQVTKADHNRQSGLSKRIREKASKSDYTDVRGVKRMFAEEEAAYKNTSNISGVADLFNVSATPASAAFTTLFNKKPLRTYQSKSPSPYKLSRLEIDRKSLDASPAESSVSSDVVNWVKTVNQQFVTNELGLVSQASPIKEVKLKTPGVALKRSKRLASRTPTPSKNVDSPSARRLRTVKEKSITSTSLENKIDSNETEDVTKGKKVNAGILKETVNSNINSPVTTKRTRKNKNRGETTKENLTPDQSDTASDIQAKQVTFQIEETEETRRSKRTPRKPAKFSGFISDLLSTNVTNKELQEEKQEVVRQTALKRGTIIADKETNETSEEPGVKISRKKTETVNKLVDQPEKKNSQIIIENGEGKKRATRRRGKQVKEIEKSPTITETVEDKKPAKRLRGKQDIAEDEKVDEELEKQKSEAVTENDAKGKNLPTRGRKRKQINEKLDQSENESKTNNMKKLEETQPVKRRGRKPQIDKKPDSENESECSPEAQKPAKRGRPKVNQSENESAVSSTKDLKQKPVTRRGRKRINEEENQIEMKQLVVDNPVEIAPVPKRARKNGKIDQLEEENKKPVKTRGRKQETVNESDQNDDEESEVKKKTVRRRGCKQVVNTKTEQVESDSEVVSNKVKVNGKPTAAKRGRKPAVQRHIVSEEELDEISETVDSSDAKPLRRATRRGATKRVSSPDGNSSLSSNISQQKGKRGRKESVKDVPIRKSARTRR